MLYDFSGWVVVLSVIVVCLPNLIACLGLACILRFLVVCLVLLFWGWFGGSLSFLCYDLVIC